MSNSKMQKKREQEAQVKRTEIHQGVIFKVVRDEITFDHQNTKTFDLVLHPGAVALIPINANGEILLVKQWRRAAQKILIELPAGTLEKDEDPLDCADRELREETNISVSDKALQGCLESVQVFDSPVRDLRGRFVTHAHKFHLDDGRPLPEVKGGDDAAEALWVPLAEVMRSESQMFADHYHIVQSMMGII